MTSHDDYARSAGYRLTDTGGENLLLMLHGLGADSSQPSALVEGLSFENTALLAPDARAHGESRAIGDDQDFTFSAMVQDLLALLRLLEQDRKPTHLVGISMGAALALRTALGGQLDIRSITLIRPAFNSTRVPQNLEVMALIGDLLAAFDPQRAREEFLLSEAYAAVAHISQLGAKSLLSQFEVPLARQRSVRLRAVPRNVAYASAHELSLVEAPTVVVGTQCDPVHPLALAEEWAHAIPTARLEIVPPRDLDPDLTHYRLSRIVSATVEAHTQ